MVHALQPLAHRDGEQVQVGGNQVMVMFMPGLMWGPCVWVQSADGAKVSVDVRSS